MVKNIIIDHIIFLNRRIRIVTEILLWDEDRYTAVVFLQVIGECGKKYLQILF